MAAMRFLLRGGVTLAAPDHALHAAAEFGGTAETLVLLNEARASAKTPA